MSPTVKRAVAAAAVLFLALLLWLGNLLFAVRGAPGPVVRDGPPTAPKAAPPPAPPAPTPVAEPAPRVVLPAPDPARPVGDEGPHQAPVRLAEMGTLQDRREELPDDAEWAAAGIQLGLATVSEEIEQCLQEWSADIGDLEGSVMVGFQIDADGLQEAWLEDVEALPEGPLDCFGDAVHALDWAGVTEQPVEITTRFEVEDDRPTDPEP